MILDKRLLSVTFLGIGAEFYESSKWVRVSGLLPLGVFLQAVVSKVDEEKIASVFKALVDTIFSFQKNKLG